MRTFNQNTVTHFGDEKGIGMFVVPTEFFASHHVSLLRNYANTLNHEELFELIPPEETVTELELPEQLRDIGDDDIVEITIDEDGNMTITVTKADESPEDDDCEDDDCCCCEQRKGFLGLLEQILAELKKLNGSSDEDGEVKKPLWQRIGESVGDTIGGVLGGAGQGAGSFIGNIAEGVGNGLGGIFGGAGEGTGSFVGNIAEGVGNGLGSIFGGAGEGAGSFIGNIAEGVGSGIGSAFDGAGTLVTGISNAVSSSLGSVLGGIFGEGSGFFGAIVDLITAIINLPVDLIKAIAELEIFDGIATIIEAIGDIIENILDFLTMLIIPSEGFLEDTFNDLSGSFNEKIPIINQARELFEGIADVVSNPEESNVQEYSQNPQAFISSIEPQHKQFLPSYDDSINSKEPQDYSPVFSGQFEIYGVSVNLLDFSWFEQYRLRVHAFVLAFAYLTFTRRLIKRLPSIVGGFYS
jgi:hypothetical protein